MKKAITKLRGFWLPGSTPEWTPAHKRLTHIAFVVVVVFGLSIPDDIITANVWARQFTDFMAMLIPQIDNVSRVNLHSDTNRFLYSFLWAISPLFLPLLIKEQLNLIEVEDVKKKREIDWSLHLLRIIFFVCFAALALFWMAYKPTLRTSYFIFINPYGKAIGAFLLVYAPLWSLCYPISLFVSIRRGTYPVKGSF
jgi:hypothetical protein